MFSFSFSFSKFSLLLHRHGTASPANKFCAQFQSNSLRPCIPFISDFILHLQILFFFCRSLTPTSCYKLLPVWSFLALFLSVLHLSATEKSNRSNKSPALNVANMPRLFDAVLQASPSLHSFTPYGDCHHATMCPAAFVILCHNHYPSVPISSRPEPWPATHTHSHPQKSTLSVGRGRSLPCRHKFKKRISPKNEFRLTFATFDA